MKALTILLVCVFLSACSSSSAPTGNGSTTINGQTITGAVRDSFAMPIRGALVTLEEPTTILSTNTDSVGRYEFDVVPAGLFPMKATMAKYSTDSESTLVVTGSNSTQSFTISRILPIVPQTGLVCLYRCTGNMLDSSTHHHDGRATGCQYVADRFNRTGSAIHFNGASDLVTIADSADLNFGDSSDFTICLWMKADTTTREALVLSKMNMVPRGIGYQFEMSDNLITAWAISNIGTAGTYIDSPNNPVITGAWHFLVVVVSGKTATETPWYDGQQFNKTQTPILTGSFANTAPLTLGNKFPGTLDDIRIYRRALSADEISALYHENSW